MAVCSFANQSYRYDDNYSGAYTGGPYKGLLHTTEGGSLPTYSGGATAPHFTVVPDFRTKTVRVYQHYNTARPARALLNKAGGVQTNNDSVVQIELVGTCDPRTAAKYPSIMYWPRAPKWALDGLAKLMRWIEANHGVPRRSTPRPWVAYPHSYGNSPARMSGAEFDNFAGWLGHQHAAENDHGDPGDLDIAYLIDGPAASTTVVKVATTIGALATALGLSIAALLGANPSLPVAPDATVTPGATITVPAPVPAPAPVAPPASKPSPAPAKVTYPVLRVGAYGAYVRLVQRAVGARVDGDFGPATDRAVRAYQAARGLTPDGIVGARTWAAINTGAKPTTAPRATISHPTLRQGATGVHVRTVQRAVGVRADGVFGPVTDRAVRAFQRAHGLVADGVVGPRTWGAIL